MCAPNKGSPMNVFEKHIPHGLTLLKSNLVFDKTRYLCSQHSIWAVAGTK